MVMFGRLRTPLADVFQGSSESVEDIMQGSVIRVVYIIVVSVSSFCLQLHQSLRVGSIIILDLELFALLV
jgi:hypothetical protein